MVSRRRVKALRELKVEVLDRLQAYLDARDAPAQQAVAEVFNNFVVDAAQTLGVPLPEGLPPDSAAFVQLSVPRADALLSGLIKLAAREQFRAIVQRRLRRPPGWKLALGVILSTYEFVGTLCGFAFYASFMRVGLRAAWGSTVAATARSWRAGWLEALLTFGGAVGAAAAVLLVLYFQYDHAQRKLDIGELGQHEEAARLLLQVVAAEDQQLAAGPAGEGQALQLQQVQVVPAGDQQLAVAPPLQQDQQQGQQVVLAGEVQLAVALPLQQDQQQDEQVVPAGDAPPEPAGLVFPRCQHIITTFLNNLTLTLVEAEEEADDLLFGR